MPHLGKLIEAFKNRDKTLILNYMDQGNAKNKKELMLEIQEIKERYSSDQELSFIPECLNNLINHLIPKSTKEECVQNFFTLFPEYKLSTSSEVVKKLSSYLNVADCISLPAASADKSR